MRDWFKVEKIDETTFAISEYEHWEEVHSYLLIGEEYSLLIDTGLGIGSIRTVVESLTKLPVLVVATHIHWDHIGGHKEFDTHYVHELEKEWLINGIPLPLEIIKSNVVKNVECFPITFDIDKYSVFTSDNSNIIYDAYIFEIGGREIEVIHTPGHSPGHVCFYEKERKYLFSGDLVYKGILYMNYPSTDPKLFSSSIDKISKLDIEKILPSHHELDIHTGLIDEIKSAFNVIESSVGLKHGVGMFEFSNFKILI